MSMRSVMLTRGTVEDLAKAKHLPWQGAIPWPSTVRMIVDADYWIRETWCDANSCDGPVVCYRAGYGRRYLMDELEEDEDELNYDRYPGGLFAAWAADVEAGDSGGRGWRHPMQMPEWAARFVLRVTGACGRQDRERWATVWLHTRRDAW